MEAFVKSKLMIVFLFACDGGRQMERKQEAERQRKRQAREGGRETETERQRDRDRGTECLIIHVSDDFPHLVWGCFQILSVIINRDFVF